MTAIFSIDWQKGSNCFLAYFYIYPNTNILQQVFLLQNEIISGNDTRRINIQTQTHNSFEIQAALSVAQCISYNSTFRHRKQATGTYHNTMREPPLPIYVGLLLHGETRKRSLVDKFYELGLSVSYYRVLSISADLGNDISELYKSEGVVCPRQLRYGVFTTATYDNMAYIITHHQTQPLELFMEQQYLYSSIHATQIAARQG